MKIAIFSDLLDPPPSPEHRGNRSIHSLYRPFSVRRIREKQIVLHQVVDCTRDILRIIEISLNKIRTLFFCQFPLKQLLSSPKA